MSTDRRFFVATVALALAGQTFCRAADFQAGIDAIYYSDSSGRTINYDFSSGSMDTNRVITIPSGAITARPASESAATFLWEPGEQWRDVSLIGGLYSLSVPQALPAVVPIPTAAITVDGSPDDWADVTPYIQDATADVWWAGVSGADVELLKLAYSPDYSKLYILLKLTENVNQGLCYRLFLDQDLNRGHSLQTVYEIDLAMSYVESPARWAAVCNGWRSNDAGDSYSINAHGVVGVWGPYLEASVDCAPFGLPAPLCVFGRTVWFGLPNPDLDSFTSSFETVDGYACLTADYTVASAPTTWQLAARIKDFVNPGFGDSSPYLHYFGPTLSGGGSSEQCALQPRLAAVWVTGDFQDTDLDQTLVIIARVEKHSDSGAYYWTWEPSYGGGVVLGELDPATTVVDLKMAVSSGGQKVDFYYRINSTSTLDSGTGWLPATSHTLPGGTGTMDGLPTITPAVGLETSFERAAPVYRFYNKLNGKHFFTIDRAEKNHILAMWPWVFDFEGTKFYTYAEDSQPGVLPVYRFYSEALGTHFYTISETEKNHLINDTPAKFFWAFEGPAYYAWPVGSQPDGAKPVYRFWSSAIGSHVYTTSTAERDKLLTTPASWFWTYEGIAFYVQARDVGS